MDIPDNLQQKIYSWRQDYGPIYVAKVEGKQYAYRGLTLKEYLTIGVLESLDEMALEDVIIKRTVLYPESLDLEKHPNLPSELSKQIVESSGFGDNQRQLQMLTDIRKTLENEGLQHMIIMICQAFPSYTPEDIENMDIETFMERFAQSEIVIGRKARIRPQQETPQERSSRRKTLGNRMSGQSSEPERSTGPTQEQTEQALSATSRALAEQFAEQGIQTARRASTQMLDINKDQEQVHKLMNRMNTSQKIRDITPNIKTNAK